MPSAAFTILWRLGLGVVFSQKFEQELLAYVNRTERHMYEKVVPQAKNEMTAESGNLKTQIYSLNEKRTCSPVELCKWWSEHGALLREQRCPAESYADSGAVNRHAVQYVIETVFTKLAGLDQLANQIQQLPGILEESARTKKSVGVQIGQAATDGMSKELLDRWTQTEFDIESEIRSRLAAATAEKVPPPEEKGEKKKRRRRKKRHEEDENEAARKLQTAAVDVEKELPKQAWILAEKAGVDVQKLFEKIEKKERKAERDSRRREHEKKKPKRRERGSH